MEKLYIITGRREDDPYFNWIEGYFTSKDKAIEYLKNVKNASHVKNDLWQYRETHKIWSYWIDEEEFTN